MRELFKILPSAISKEQISKILEISTKKPMSDASIFSTYRPMQKIRSSKICWISDQWIKDLLWKYVKNVNEINFHVNVDNISELEFTEYRSEENGHYDWHHDVNWSSEDIFDRKISVTVQLSDEKEYEGGNFEFDEIKTNINFKSQGTILIFPSYLRHKVTPVKSGIRRSLVAWFFGPNWQ